MRVRVLKKAVNLTSESSMRASGNRKLPLLTNSRTLQRVMETLAQRAPLSAAELAREAAVSLSTLVNGGYLKSLKDGGHIFVAGWGKNTNGFTIALYRPGNLPDCPRPKFQDIDRDSVGLARIVAALKSRPGQTYLELAKAANLSSNTVRGRGYMEILLKQQRVHVSDWRRSRSGSPCPLYSAGPGENAPKPESLTRAEIQARHRMRVAIKNGVSATLGQQLDQIAIAVAAKEFAA